jgi:hypothetical protein
MGILTALTAGFGEVAVIPEIAISVADAIYLAMVSRSVVRQDIF